MNLAELQRYFAEAATSGSGPVAGLEQVFVGSEGLPAQERLAIYNRCYFHRLLDALASVFAHTRSVLGEPDFQRLGLSYLAHHPSEHPAIERVGRRFAEYLRSAGVSPVIVDLASLEWTRLCALVACKEANIAGRDAVDPTRFPSAHLRFVPSLHRLELDPRAIELFESKTTVQVELGTTQGAARGVAVWRQGHTVHHQIMDGVEWRALTCATGGAELSEVCAVFDTGSVSEDVQLAFQVISRWFERQWLESLIYDDEQRFPRPPS